LYKKTVENLWAVQPRLLIFFSLFFMEERTATASLVSKKEMNLPFWNDVIKFLGSFNVADFFHAFLTANFGCLFLFCEKQRFLTGNNVIFELILDVCLKIFRLILLFLWFLWKYCSYLHGCWSIWSVPLFYIV